MSDDRDVDLEARLRESLRGAELPKAPARLRVRLEEITAEPVRPRRSVSRGWWILAPIAAVLLGGYYGLVGGRPVASDQSSPSAPPSSVDVVPTAIDVIPTTIDGLAVMTISEVLAKQAAGTLHNDSVAVGGYWSDGSVGHSCAPPDSQPGELEMYCHGGEWGMTTLNEPIIVITRNGYVTDPTGPHLTPWFPNDLPRLTDLFNLPIINGQRYPPVPIVVIGHMNDSRAADCRPQARQACLDRLVVERIALFGIDSVPTPGVSPTPTQFPSPAPPRLFGPESCSGNVPYSFVGWTTTADLQLPFEREGHVWAMVTRDPVLLGGDGWNEDPNGSSHKFRPWGRRICIAEEGMEGSVEFGAVPGSSYQEWDDGHRTPLTP